MKILLIEDDDLDAESVTRMLRRIAVVNFSVTRCDCLAGAVSHLEKGAFDVLLVDLGLPDSQGVGIVTRLTAMAPESALIVQTGNDSESDAMEAVAAGGQDYLIKGRFDGDGLFRAIRYAYSRKQLENRFRKVNQDLEAALRELKQVQADRIRMERLQAVERVSRGIAHDINNALTPIVASADYLSTLAATERWGGRSREMLLGIKESAQVVASVVSRLRAFYQPSAGENEGTTFDVGTVMDHLQHEVSSGWIDGARELGKEVAFEWDVLPGCFVEGDPSAFTEALTELVKNAMDAVTVQGRVGLQVTRNSEDVRIVVTDDGQGMSEDMVTRCFEPFVSSKPDSGAGTGLTRAQDIVSRMGGKIEARSELGAGARVLIQLPLAAPEEATVGDVEPPVGRASGGRVLLCDDEESVRLIGSALLSQEGFTCQTAEDAEMALDILGSAEFDLVITDRSMPGMSGDALAHRIRETWPQLPVIMLTGFGDLMIAAEEQPFGVDQVVAKPFDQATLLQAIDSTMNKHASGAPE